MDARQFSKNEAVFQLTMMMESILEASDVIFPTIKSYYRDEAKLLRWSLYYREFPSKQPTR